MQRRWKVLACALAAMVAAPSAALAHDPEELSGTPLTNPFGHKFWFHANFQTAQNPFNAANTHVTSSDIAFWGDLAYVGDYGGFRIFDISRPVPRLVSDMRCYGPQGDPSVFDRDGNGKADTLVLSVDSVLTGPRVRRRAGGQAADGRVPGRRVGGHPDLRRLQPARAEADRDRLPGLRLAHEHAAARPAAPALDVRPELELPARRRPDLRPARRAEGPQGQPRRRAGRRDPVPRPARGARADGAADRLSG